MATVNSKRKQVVKDLISYGNVPNVRTIAFDIDFAVEGSVATGDDLAVFTLPKGTVVLAVFLEQITPDLVNTTNTLVARLGSVTYSATLAGNAAAGTVTAQTTSTAFLNAVLTADTDVNVLTATAARANGKVRLSAVVVEGRVPQVATTAPRDFLA